MFQLLLFVVLCLILYDFVARSARVMTSLEIGLAATKESFGKVQPHGFQLKKSEKCVK